MLVPQRVKIELSDKKDKAHSQVTGPYIGDRMTGRSYVRIDDVNSKQCYQKSPRNGSTAKYLFYNGIFWCLCDQLDPGISVTALAAYQVPLHAELDEHFPHGYTQWRWKVGTDKWVEVMMNIKFSPGTAGSGDSIKPFVPPQDGSRPAAAAAGETTSTAPDGPGQPTGGD
eukprot:SAG22_NODE_46_length_24705_cov_89.861010_15_plen_170_part_00